MSGRFADVHARSLSDPESFWGEAAEAIHWSRRWDRVLDDSNPPMYRWFVGGELNTCYNALDVHVENGRGDQAALIYDSPVTGAKRQYTYTELRDEVARFAGVLSGLGVGRGDRVLVYMPMVPEALVAMLACARLGAVHSVVFGGFAANELAVRIDDATPAAIVSASCGIEPGRVVEYKPLLDGAIELAAHKPSSCVILQRDRAPCELIEGRDVDWTEAMSTAEAHDCVPVAATDPLYILYTSGTTGQPKGVVRDNGGHAVALKWTMKNIYGVEPGEVYWAASDVGWVVGHSYICYAPLLNGNTTIIYEGKPVGTPDAGAFWRVLAEYGVSVLFTAPTAFRAIRQQDPEGKLLEDYDLSRFRTLFLAGERLDPDTLAWAQAKLGVPVIDHWWQTETGWSICANCIGIEEMPIKEGSPTRAVPGMDVQAVDDACNPVPAGDIGALVVKLPLPPGTLPTLWNAEQRLREAYFEEFPGVLQDRRRRLHRRGRLRLRDDPDRRRHQRRRSSPVHRGDGGGARLPPRCRGMRGHWSRGPAQGTAAPGLPRSQRGLCAIGGRNPPRRRQARAGTDRSGGGVQDRDHRAAAPQDAFGQDSARDDAEDCRQRRMEDAGHD